MKPVAPAEKFYDYIFKPGATHGKDHVFRSLGYDRSDSQMLSELYSLQADAKYAAQDYTLGKADEYGQRINIVIELTLNTLTEENNYSSRSIYLVSGWMIRDDDTLTLNTPFSGFAR
jgi:filamentous hemagglutinin